MALVSELMPPYSAEQVDRGLARALLAVSSHGTTSMIDPAARPWMLDGYRRAASQGKALCVDLAGGRLRALRARPRDVHGAREL